MKISSFSIVVLLVLFAAGCSKKTNNNNCTWGTVFSDSFHRSDTIIGSDFQVIIQPTQYGGHGFADIFNNSLRISSDSVFWAVVCTHEVENSKSRVSVECTTPLSGGSCAFAVGGKLIYAGTTTQSGYFAIAMNDVIGIYKIEDGVMTALATQTYALAFNHTYKISFTCDNGNLTASLTDVITGSGATVGTTDTGSLPSGKQYSINGNSLGGQVVLLFNNFMIETCQ